MKYIDADRLRARIEKDLAFDNSIDTAYYIGRRDEERSILALIDSLQQEQPHWKPSENQMSMLLAVVNDPNNAGSESCHLSLESLYNDLKKL